MCDYSLYEFPNRLAQEREELVVHRFPSGALGLASAREVRNTSRMPALKLSLWASIKGFFNELFAPGLKTPVCAICVPPGARLILKDIPAQFQRALGLADEEGAIFIETSANVHTYRDAVQFRNGRRVRLQDLCVGQRVEIRSLGSDESVAEVEPEPGIAVLQGE